MKKITIALSDKRYEKLQSYAREARGVTLRRFINIELDELQREYEGKRW